MTGEESLTLRVADALITSGIPYLLAGSFASNYHGIPRSTKDADFVVQTGTGLGPEFANLLGGDFKMDPQLTFEMVTGTHRQFIRHTRSAFKVELFLLSKDEHDQQRFARRSEVEMFGRKVCLLTAEDVIISKLRWGRNKDEDDIRKVMSVQRGKLDMAYIESWCRRHGTTAMLEAIRSSVPEI